ncbi:MAG: hypothetical protein U9M95_06825 [Candidatus Altiarchaeota archaeon]|nr:hypothetical protein [Candidatus Altiarchaeota archaeon]
MDKRWLLAGGVLLILFGFFVLLAALGIAGFWYYSSFQTSSSTSTTLWLSSPILSSTLTSIPSTVPTSTTTSTSLTTTTSTSLTTTTSTSTSTTTSSTTTTLSAAYSHCALDYDVSPDTVIYVYTQECCVPLVSDRVRVVDNQGYRFRYVDALSMSSGDRQLLGCYMNLRDIYVPQFICSGSGESMVLTDPGGMTDKIKKFAGECRG